MFWPKIAGFKLDQVGRMAAIEIIKEKGQGLGLEFARPLDIIGGIITDLRKIGSRVPPIITITRII